MTTKSTILIACILAAAIFASACGPAASSQVRTGNDAASEQETGTEDGGAESTPAPEHAVESHGQDSHTTAVGDTHPDQPGGKFADAESWARRFDDPDRDEWQKPDEVIELAKIEPGMSVVDLGAGTGYFLPHLAAAVGDTGKVVGMDLEPNMVKYMNDRAEEAGLTQVSAVEVAGGDDPGIEKVFPKGADRILVVDTWHHFPNRAEYASLLRQSLAPGGRLVVVDWAMDSEEGPPAEHKLSVEAAAAELEAGGFSAVAIAEETLPHQYVIIAVP